MPRKRNSRADTAPETVTAKRAARLYRLLKTVAKPQSRSALVRRLGLDVRSFYRDLVVLRSCGIDLVLVQRRYQLALPLAAAVARLPFPNPHLTLAEAMQLAKGKSPAHRKLKQQIGQIVR